MELMVSEQGVKAHFVFKGNIDEKGAEALHKRFTELDKSSLKELVLDLKNVKYMGSSAIGQLITFYQVLAAGGGIIRIENVSKDIYDLLVDLNMDKLASITRA